VADHAVCFSEVLLQAVYPVRRLKLLVIPNVFVNLIHSLQPQPSVVSRHTPVVRVFRAVIYTAIYSLNRCL
jgi:hypothetical protein